MSTCSGYQGFNVASAVGPAQGATVLILGATGANNVAIADNHLANQGFFANSKVSVNATGSGNTYVFLGNVDATNVQFGALDGGNATTLVGFDNLSGRTITINGVANGNFAGTIFNGVSAGANNVVKTGGATQVLSGSNTYTGSTTINDGMLQLGDGTSGHDGSISATSGVTDNAALVYDLFGSQTASYRISGSGSLTKVGQGMLTLSGTNSYTGSTIVEAGALIAGSPVTIADGTSLTVGDPSMFPPPVVPSRVESPKMASVPEPGTLALFSAAVCGAAIYRRLCSRRKKQ